MHVVATTAAKLVPLSTPPAGLRRPDSTPLSLHKRSQRRKRNLSAQTAPLKPSATAHHQPTNGSFESHSEAPFAASVFPQQSEDALAGRRRVLGALALAPALMLPVVRPEAVRAGEGDEGTAAAVGAANAGGPRITETVFMDLSVDGAPIGRILIGLYGESVPLGAARFAQLSRGVLGVSYRRKEVSRLTPTYLQGGALRAFSISGARADPDAFVGGVDAEGVAAELRQLQGPNQLYNSAFSVSLFAIDPSIPPPKQKLVARGGRLEMVEEALKQPPNGTDFAITFSDCPDLDATHLVVGRVVAGFETLKTVQVVPFVRDNGDNPYFKAAKMIGDTRAVVAERGFYRPYKKIIISRVGIQE